MSPEPKNGPKRRAKRTTKSESSTTLPKPGVGLEVDAHAGLLQGAKRLHMSGIEFASAAIRYFVVNALDPRKSSGLQEGVLTRALLGENIQKLRQEQVAIGNQLVQLIEESETRQRALLQMHQDSLVAHLQQSETTVLAQLTFIQTQVLTPLMEQILRGNAESKLARRLIHRLTLELDKQYITRIPDAKEFEQMQRLDQMRERNVVEEMKKIVQSTAAF